MCDNNVTTTSVVGPTKTLAVVAPEPTTFTTQVHFFLSLSLTELGSWRGGREGKGAGIGVEGGESVAMGGRNE